MTIRRKTWYLAMLFLPLLSPLAFYGIVLLFGYRESMAWFDELGGITLRFLAICSLIGGIPYCLFALGTMVWLKRKTVDQIRFASWWLPWIFTLHCGLFFFLLFLYEKPEGSAIQAALVVAAICIPVGFLYVFIVHELTKPLVTLHWIKD